MTLVRQNLAAKFTDKAYRDAFVAEQIFSRLPLKIRCLREEQGMTQRQLGDVAGMAQTWVSKLEDPNYGKLTIATLLKVASALDVGLKIDFVPYSAVLREAVYRTGASFSVPSFKVDAGFSSAGVEYLGAVNHATAALSATVINFPSNASVASVSAPADTPAPERALVLAQAV
ncbi:MAG: helix-turn-helix transcriptional regulator, partial [Candidatus Sulfotelmatobacter sp.]